MIELGFRQRLGHRQITAAVELVATFDQVGLGLSQRRRRLGAIEFDEHRTGSNPLPLDEANGRDGIGRFRGDFDRFFGERRADGFDDDSEGAFFHRARDDGRRGSARAARTTESATRLTATRGGRLGARSQRESDGEQSQSEPGHGKHDEKPADQRMPGESGGGF